MTIQAKMCLECREIKKSYDFYESYNEAEHPDGLEDVCKSCKRALLHKALEESGFKKDLEEEISRKKKAIEEGLNASGTMCVTEAQNLVIAHLPREIAERIKNKNKKGGN